MENNGLTPTPQSSNSSPAPISDVAHPSSVGAQQTSRPVITNNQPVGSDPMMTEKPTPIESRIVSKMPTEKLHQELYAEVAPSAEHGTLHDMYPKDAMIGQVKKKGRKRRALRLLLLIAGFILSIASVAYYFLVFVNQ